MAWRLARMRSGFIIALLLGALCVAPALAQEQAPARDQFDLGAVTGLLSRSSDPVWRGRGGFDIKVGATARLLAGPHSAGEHFAEIEVVPRRTARLTEAVAIEDSRHGSLSLATGTIVYARNQQLIGTGGGVPTQRIDGALRWCTLEGLCIIARNATTAEYRGAEQSARSWIGPMPSIREEPVVLHTPFIRRLGIHDIQAEGIILDRYVVLGEQRVLGEGLFGPGPVDRGLTDQTYFNDLRFRFRRGGEGQVVVER